jgi:nitric oxide reductase NorE protein
MIWVFILTEVVTFGLLLMTFIVTEAVQPDVFAAGRAQRDPILGGINTLVPVTSGWLAALAVETRVVERRRTARLLLAGAALLGGPSSRSRSWNTQSRPRRASIWRRTRSSRSTSS